MMVPGSRLTDIYARRAEENGWLGLAADIVYDAVEAVRKGNPGAEVFFYSRRGDNLITGLGLDVEMLKEILGLPETYNYPDFVEVQGEMTNELTGLEKLAAEMETEAAKNYKQPVKVSLNGGLNLTLTYHLTEWRLSLSRRNAAVTYKEQESCAKAFGVPDDARQETAKQEMNGTTWHIARFIWPSARQMSFIEQANGGMAAVPTANNYTND